MKNTYFLLFAILSIMAFQTCKTRENTAGKKEKQDTGQIIATKDTIPDKEKTDVVIVQSEEAQNNPDNTKKSTIQDDSIKDSISAEKIPVMNPKLYNSAYIIVDDNESSEPEYAKFESKPQIERTEISNFNPFLEEMYPNAKWYHDKYNDFENYVNRYRAIYKGTEFSFQAINSFVYYFHDIGDLSHENLIKTAIYWIIYPEHPDIIINETKLIGERDFNKTISMKIKLKDYKTICKADNKILEVYTIIEEDKLYNFKALLNNRLYCNYGSYIGILLD